MTYDDIIKLLKARYAPPAWAFLQQVGDRTGAYTSRHADAIAMGLYPSRGLELLGFEIKVSRGDWRRELKNPSKAEPVARRCDRWYVVAPAEIVPVLEVPANWGLIEAKNGKLRETKPAEKLEPEPLDHAFLAAILRRASLEDPAREMEIRIRHEIRDELLKDLVPARVEMELAPLQGELERLRKRVEQFEATTGVPLEDHQQRGYYGFPSGEALGRAVLYLAGGGQQQLRWQMDSIDRVIEHLQQATAIGRELIADPELPEV